ncbi:MAG: cupin domain-containing protein [Gemmobacter sp.]
MTRLASSAPHIHDAARYDDLADWGPQPDAVVPGSQSTGRLLWKGPGGQPEAGLWVCTPGAWRLALPRDEFCHFVAGRATYAADDGAVIDVAAGTCILFPAGWSGTCTVHETIRNLYMLA